MEILFKYSGLDWLSMVFSLCAMLLLGSKIKWGFLFFIIANIIMIAVSILMIESVALTVGNSVFLVTNLRGFLRWNSENQKT